MLRDFFCPIFRRHMGYKKSPKFAKSITCNLCDYSCFKQSDFNKHLLSSKHQKKNKMMTNDYTKVAEFAETIFTCECGKEYKHRQGLWRHKKLCLFQEENEMPITDPIVEFTTTSDPNQLAIITELFHEQLKENKELKEMLIEQNKKLIELAEKGQTTNNITNNNTSNNTNNFNLQFFLNEQCKDALNIMDFINQLQLKTSDLDMVGRVGYSEGISKLFIRGLKELDVFKRPIHCSDLKREVLYVKDKDYWEKDNDEKKKMKNAIKYIAAKNFKQIHEWQEENPDSNDHDSKKNTDYNQIVLNSMGGATEEEDENNYNKIIRNVAKEVTIDKK